MVDSSPISAGDQAVVDRLLHDDAVAAWLAQRVPAKRRTLGDLLIDRDVVRALLTATLVPLLGWLAIQGYAAVEAIYHRQDRANAEAKAAVAAQWAETRQDVAQITALMPYLAGSRPQRDIALPVLKAMDRRDRSDSLSSILFDKVSERAETDRLSDDHEVRSAAVKDIELLSASSAPTITVAQTAPPPAGSVVAQLPATTVEVKPQLAYIQIYGEDQRPQAEVLAAALRAAGVPVPGIENIVQTHGDAARRFAQRGTIGIRYYKAGDQAGAVFAAGLIERTLPGVSAPRLQSLERRAARVKTGLLEIWFPCGASQGCG